jgi:hypothetical protein
MIGMGRCLFEQFADLQAALAILIESERTRQCAARATFGQVGHRQRFTGVLLKLGLGIERIDVRWSAIEEEVDHAFGLGREMRLAFSE